MLEWSLVVPSSDHWMATPTSSMASTRPMQLLVGATNETAATVEGHRLHPTVHPTFSHGFEECSQLSKSDVCISELTNLVKKRSPKPTNPEMIEQ